MSHPFDEPQSGGLIPWYFNPAILFLIGLSIIIMIAIIKEVLK